MSAIYPPEPPRHGGYYINGRIYGRRKYDLHFAHGDAEPVPQICDVGDHEDGSLDAGPSRLMAAVICLGWLAFAALCGLALGWAANVVGL